ncbi:DUF4349 domain-containing protein [Nocardioides rubriscoriae]|uniref:DUF4349 domain-containing protein n=1 Tax=Nocardioides rubriscoriae TaxID=642762 RepID=UPI0011DFD764|nr:DUF4349 domain-containing protein [Nocardioides rubriscoriae]
MTTRARRLAAAAACTALLGLGVSACSAGDDQSSSDSGSASDSSDVAGADVAAGVPAAEDAPQAPAGAGALASDVARKVEPDPTTSRSLIKKGDVALRSTDVGDTLFRVGAIVQAASGEVAENTTQADEAGEPENALLTVRVPVGQFDTTMRQLEQIGTERDGVDLISSDETSSDVSTEVIDVDVRVELQKRSIERISVLLDRATSIRDIVGIERELADREADLGSLQKRQAFLADQTSLSTITISLERPSEKRAAAEKEKDDTGFVAGLENGWDAFTSVTAALLTTVGALLPFAIVLLLVGVPLRVWLRRRGSSTPAVSA